MINKKDEVIVLGAGISGLSAAYHLKVDNNVKSLVLEKRSSYGGLLDNFVIDGFTFDNFVHLSFTKDEYVKKLFAESSEFVLHNPQPCNHYKGLWIKHPVQNNLHALPIMMRLRIIAGFVLRRNKELKNYEDFLHASYGKYFSSLFPVQYTRKYWLSEPKDLGVGWVGPRMYRPTLKEVLQGAFNANTKDVYYSGEMRYPIQGGFKSFLSKMVENLEINYNSNVIKIDPQNKVLTLQGGGTYQYESLISSIPLPEYLRLIDDIPDEIKTALKNLRWTSAAIISLGFNRPDIAKHLWFYIYDEDILASRIHSPSLKSKFNVPKGCSSLQSEIYFSINDEKIKPQKLMEREIKNYIKYGFFNEEDLILKDIKIINYANIIFDHDIYKNRKIVREWLTGLKIKTIGRYGEWDYLWTDQSLLSGKSAALNEILMIGDNGNNG
jgi:protoporphyrinogen oxidase